MGLLLQKIFTDHKLQTLRKITGAVVNTVVKRYKRHLQVVFLPYFQCEQSCFETSQPKVLKMITFVYLFRPAQLKFKNHTRKYNHS